MRGGGPLLWIGKSRETEVLERCDEHMKKVVETVEAMNRAFQHACSLKEKEAKKAFWEAFKREKEADKAKKEILEDLSKKIFQPLNRDEIVRLVMTTDDVASNAKAAARKLTFLNLKELTPELRKLLSHFSSRVLEISKTTYKNFLALIQNPSSAIKVSHEVERIEEEIDDFRGEKLIPKLLEWQNRNRSVGSSLLLKEIADNLEEVADRCEDVSDLIRYIALSHL
jgi:predicted phosphate transport protein (TIGR00153 family)